ncbi:MAG: uridine kinase [Patescibacteria group bacterium]|nr:uridine kinase [Patescibacteria group bacterium]
MHCGKVWKRKAEVSKEECYIIGIGGGTGSGKSTLANELRRQFSDHGGAVLMSMDDYYLDQRDVPIEERPKKNYDDPKSMDVELLASDLLSLKSGESINKPLYDFEKHTRKEETETIDPVAWVFVEGILTLHYNQLLELFDVTIFVDAPADIRFIRRLSRDTKERGRTMDSVLLQYLATVRPMHEEFVEPSRENAELKVSCEHEFGENIRFIMTHIGKNTGMKLDIKPVEVQYE